MSRADLVEDIGNAMDAVNDMDVTIEDYAEAVVAHLEASGALRAEVPGDADERLMSAYRVKAELNDEANRLRQQLAAAQAEITECCLQSLASMDQAREAYAAQVKAEKERDALRAALMSIANATNDVTGGATFVAIARAALNTGEPS